MLDFRYMRSHAALERRLIPAVVWQLSIMQEPCSSHATSNHNLVRSRSSKGAACWIWCYETFHGLVAFRSFGHPPLLHLAWAPGFPISHPTRAGHHRSSTCCTRKATMLCPPNAERHISQTSRLTGMIVVVYHIDGGFWAKLSIY